MAKGKTSVFFCQECGYESAKWMGQCPACKEWNTFVEETVDKKSISSSGKVKKESKAAQVLPLSAVKSEKEERIVTGIAEFDRVLGGGIVRGSLVLVGGDPGIGKSTLLLQVCRELSQKKVPLLYVSGEESLHQIKMRADRLGDFTDSLELLCETSLDIAKDVIQRKKPEVVVIDSIQTMYNEEIASAPGSVSQVRETTGVLMQLAKTLGISVFKAHKDRLEYMFTKDEKYSGIVDCRNESWCDSDIENYIPDGYIGTVLYMNRDALAIVSKHRKHPY